ncbi:methyltransferase domain-containing protein [Marinoscillum sp.]|uniref:methyltransferase domain-containing protein n=1 Tax=Marinoscillum sp. TaxID=2024838 RepID=UPI003BA9B624
MSLERHYDKTFFNDQTTGSLGSAREVLPFVFNLIKPESVIDFGCGRGTWLKAALDIGVKEAVGIEGYWVKKEDLFDPRIELINTNLEDEIKLGRKFDLAISLEVGEHLSYKRADSFIGDITEAADIVLFSAALPGQGGENHINEQPASFWVDKFKQRGFSYIDCIRSRFWANEKVGPAYRQNSFLFVKNEISMDIPKEYVLPASMIDIVHPIVHDWAVKRKPGIFGTLHAIKRLPGMIFRKVILRKKH